MENNRKRKKNKKAYYCNKKKAKRVLRLDEGMKGFMLTCNNKEKQCIAEAYNLLNEFADILCGPEHKKESGVAESKESSDSDEDVAKELEKELQEMKSVEIPERRFQAVDTHANNCLFIKTQINNPGELMQAILLDIEKTKKQRTRYLLRMIPVLHTCKAYSDIITKNVSVFLENYNNEIAKHKSFAVNFKARNNASIGRTEVINTLAAMIHAKNPSIKADLKNPEVVINVDIIGQICCLSVLPEYYRFKKYNLIEIASESRNEKSEQPIAQTNFSNVEEVLEKEKQMPICEKVPAQQEAVETVTQISTSAKELTPETNADSNLKLTDVLTKNGEESGQTDKFENK